MNDLVEFDDICIALEEHLKANNIEEEAPPSKSTKKRSKKVSKTSSKTPKNSTSKRKSVKSKKLKKPIYESRITDREAFYYSFDAESEEFIAKSVHFPEIEGTGFTKKEALSAMHTLILENNDAGT